MTLLAPPHEFGAPARFDSWRPAQSAAFEALLSDRRRFQSLTLPTGVGKSLAYMTYALFEDKRAVVLTSTKGLQDQLGRDFGEVGLRDVRGMSNYPCIAEGGTCDDGSCTEGAACYLKEKGCHYFDAVRAARTTQQTSTNYAWWFTQHATHQEFPTPEILICDEAHTIAEEMNNYLSVWLGDREVEWGPGAETRGPEEWKNWAKVAASAIRLGAARNKFERKKLKNLRERLLKLTRLDEEWVFERVTGGWVFDPLWPTKYLEEWLWRGAKKVILVSATLRPKTLSILGQPDAHFVEYDSPIPTQQRPIYYLPVARNSYRASDTDLWRIQSAADDIIESRLDRNGLVQCVSYARGQAMKEGSRFADLMLLPDSRDTRAVVETFKRMDPPAVLVSPAIHTGYDFPGLEASYQVIPKVPFQPPSALLKARTASDPTYPYYLALSALVQAVGRVARGPQDVGESFILDSQAGWLVGKYGEFAPRSFHKAWRRLNPDHPLPKAPSLRGVR